MNQQPFPCPTCKDLHNQSFVRIYCLGPSSSGEHHIVLEEDSETRPVVVAEVWNCDVPTCKHGSHTHIRHDQSSESTIRPWDDCRKFAERTNG